MDSELENKSQDSTASEQDQNQSSREGYKACWQLLKITVAIPVNLSVHAFILRVPTTQTEMAAMMRGGFRPEGFGAGLQSGDGASQPRPYRPRFNNNGGGYQSRDGGGYQPVSRVVVIARDITIMMVMAATSLVAAISHASKMEEDTVHATITMAKAVTSHVSRAATSLVAVISSASRWLSVSAGWIPVSARRLPVSPRWRLSAAPGWWLSAAPRWRL